jgi:hypothetical protein
VLGRERDRAFPRKGGRDGAIEVRVGVIEEPVLGNRISVDLDVVHGLGPFGELVGQGRRVVLHGPPTDTRSRPNSAPALDRE